MVNREGFGMSTELDIQILEEFDRLSDAVATHSMFCVCSDCERLMELGDLIRAHRAEQKAAGVSR